jgi:hypothetical protein
VRRSLRAHPAFAPLLGLWGAALGGGIIMVLPPSRLEGLVGAIPAPLAAYPPQLVLAAGSAAVMALMALMAGRMLSPRSGSREEAGVAAASVDPIDPAEDLGSEGLDAPLPASLFARTMDWLPELPGDDALAAEAADELAAARAASGAAEADAPRALDLAEFAVLPGRNAVWVEEPAATPAAIPDAPSPAAPSNVPAALAKLRAVPPAELSLCEMVERFAAALQEHQARPRGPVFPADIAEQREAVLAEALEALGAVARKGRFAGAGDPAAGLSGTVPNTARMAG